MGKWLDIGASICAIVAAIFWFLSASQPAHIVTYWDGAPPSDPLYAGLKTSAMLNTFAAGFSGASALLMGIRSYLR